MSTWTKEEEEIVAANFGLLPVTQWANKLPKRSIEAIKKKGQRMGLRGLPHYQSPPRYEPALPKPTDMTFDELWEACYTFQRASQELSTRQDEVDVYLDVDTPIGITFLADAHIGAVSTPLDKVRDTVYKIKDNPWLYVIGVGDKVDNYLPTKHPQGMFSTLFPPELQKDLVKNLYSELIGRWIGIVQGCHDDFSHETDDFDFTKYLAEHLGCANMGFGGLIKLHVGEQLYEIAVRHKYRYNSSFNATHTCKRLREQEYNSADIVCVAHNHITAVEHGIAAGKDRVYIRPGSMKGVDRYARSLGFSHTGYFMPTVILCPDKRKIYNFIHLDDAIDVYGGLIENYESGRL